MKRPKAFTSVAGHSVYVPPLGPNSVVADLGANRGVFSETLCKKVGGSYYLVEANPLLSQSLKEKGLFSVWQCAVASKDGFINFHVAQNDEGSSILDLPKDSPYGCALKEIIVVTSRTLDSLLQEFRVSQLDLLKMDIEGAETEVLRSLSSTALRNIGQLTVEFHSATVFGFDITDKVEEAINRLKAHGFIALDFSEGARTDILFINRNMYRISLYTRLLWRTGLFLKSRLTKVRRAVELTTGIYRS